MYRSEEDLTLLAELAGVLDQTVTDAGLSSGTYLILRQLVATEAPVPIGALSETLGADQDEIVELAGRLTAMGLADVRGAGLIATSHGRSHAGILEHKANTAMREYVLDRPHTATVYGLVASMQSGRFTVEDLLAFLAEGPTEE